MIKKSLLQGFFWCGIIYLIIIFFNLLGIRLADSFIFSSAGVVSFFIAVSVGVFMFMRI
ncbi:MAG: hypothetical protein ABIJ74_00400 [archaeon]